jgi:hypothetical protein
MILDYYDGYSWDGENRVFNPCSIIQMLSSERVTSYWYQTAAPTMFTHFLKKKCPKSVLDFPRNPIMKIADINEIDLSSPNLPSLMFQTGYLTVDKKLQDNDYLLRRPNQAVNICLNHGLLELFFAKNLEKTQALKERITKALDTFDSEALRVAFENILSWIIYPKPEKSEGLQGSIICTVLMAFSFDATFEESPSKSFMGALIKPKEKVLFVCQFKFEQLLIGKMRDKNKIQKKTNILLSKAINNAKKQIKSKKYDKAFYQKFETVKKNGCWLGWKDFRSN